MERYKIDRKKQGEKAAREYLPQLFENKKETNDTKTTGASIVKMSGQERWEAPDYKKSTLQYKNDRLENGKRLFEEYLNRSRRETGRINAWKTQPDISPGRKMVNEYMDWKKKETSGQRERVFIGSGKESRSISPAEDPDYEKYREKGEKNILMGETDGGWRGKAQSIARNVFDKAGLQSLEKMTDQEKDYYNYILGKYGSRAATDYFDSIRERLDEEWMRDEREKTRKLAKEHPVLGTAIDAIAPIASYEPYVAALAAEATGNELNINHPVFSPVTGEQELREGIKDALGRGPVKDFLADTGLSMAQSLARIPLGVGVGGLSAGLSAASSGYLDARERGGTQRQALLQGAAQGTAEGLFEKISLGNLNALRQTPGKGVKNFAKNLAKQGLIEGSEEAATEISNTLTDRLIMGEKSNYSQAYQYYREQGQNESQARLLAAADMAGNVLLSAAGGALSGGVMGAGMQAAGMRFADRTEPITKEAETGTKVQDRESLPGQENTVQKMEEEGLENQERTDPAAEKQTMIERAAEEYVTQKTGEDAELEEMFSGLEENGKRAAAENYDPSVELPDYIRAFNRYYDMGRYGIEADGFKDGGAYTAVLNRAQQEAALNAGTMDRRLSLNVRPQYTQGQPKTGGMVNHSSAATKGQIGLTEALGTKTGLTFVLEDEMGDAEGSYGSGQIRISAKSDNFLQTTSHELTHFIKEYAPQEYSVYKDIAVWALAESHSEDLEATIERYARAYEGQNLSREQLIEEIVADATGEFLNDEAFIEKVVRKDKTIAQKVIDFLSDMIDSIKSLINKESTRKVAKQLREQMRFYEDAREFWISGLEKAGETYKSGLETESEVRYQKKIEEADNGYYLDGEKVVFTEPSKIKQKQWQGMLKGFKAAGFTNYKNVQQLKDSVNIMVEILGKYDFGDERNDITYEVLLGEGSQKKELSKKELPRETMYKNALKTLGTTRYIEAAGYLTVDGKFLDFSGKQDGGKPRHRGMDHRDIQDIYEENGKEMESGTDAMIEFMKEGNIRLNPESGGINLIHKPNEKQKSSLRTFINHFDGEIYIDFSNERGEAVENFKYPKRTSASKILTDIDNYIERGKKPYISELGQFRYQLKNVDENVDIEALVKENAELKQINESLAKQLTLSRDYLPRNEDIRRISGKLLKEYNSTYSKEILEENLSKLYAYIHDSEQVDGAEVTKTATAIARAVLNKAEVKDVELANAYRDILQTIRSTTIKIPETDRSELDIEGGYEAFRKKYFGKIRFSNNGTDIDTVYQEWSGKYPDLFPENITHPADQALQIAEVVDSLKPQIQNPYEADIDELSFILGQEIFESYFDTRNMPRTLADKIQAQADETVRKYQEQMNRFKENLKARYEAQRQQDTLKREQTIRELKEKYEKASAEQKAYYKKRIEELTERKNEKLRDLMEHHKEVLRERNDRLESSKSKQRIIKTVTELRRWMLEPNDKKHIPEELKVPMANFLSMIDFSSNRLNNEGEPTKRTQAWLEARTAFERIINNESKDQDGNYLEIDPDLAAKMEELTKTVENIDKLENLSKAELKRVEETVTAIKKLIVGINTMHANERYETVTKLAEDMVKAQKKERKEYTGRIGHLQRLFTEDMLNSLSFFWQLGEQGMSLYQELKSGRDKETVNLRQAETMFKNLLKEHGVSPQQYKEWSGEKAKLHEFEFGGKEFSMTTAEIMSLYELNKRRQAQLHIYNEKGEAERKRGIRLLDRDVKGRVGTYKGKTPDPIPLSRAMVKKITDTLSEQEKAVADGIANFFQTVTTDWGNEISMTLYGYKKYNARDYFPISVDKHQIATTTDALGRPQTLKNLGFTKSTQKGAYKPIDVEDIFEVFSDRTAKMAVYNAYMLPLSDLQKWYNYNVPGTGNIKEMLDRRLGKGALRYIENLMLDINSGGNSETATTKELTRAMKSAAVGANLRTAIQQPTAYIRAAAEIDPKYLIKGLKVRTDSWDMIKKYAPIAQWKDWGFFDVHTGRTLRNILTGSDTVRERLIETSMMLASKGDEVTWKRIWEAAKAETDEKMPELKAGTEEYYKRVGERMTEIIDKTQVVDSVLNRSQIMREKTIFKQMATAFMGEPTQTYNMLYRAMYDLNQNPKSKEARKKAGKVLMVYVQTAVATAMAAAVVDALRDKEKEPYQERYVNAVLGNLSDNLNPLNMIPYLRDVVSIFSGYEVKRTDVQAVEDIYNLTKELEKAATGESKLNALGITDKILRTASSLTGVPLYNLKRDASAIINQGMQAFGNETGLGTVGLDIKNEENTTAFVTGAVSEYLKGNKTKGDRIIDDLKKAGIDEEKIDRSIKTALKDSDEIIRAAEAKKNGNYAEYEKLVSEIEKEGLSRKQAVSAINSAINKMKKEEGEEQEEENSEDKGNSEDEGKPEYLYQNSDITEAMEAGDYKRANEMADKVFMEKTRAHVKESTIRSSIKSSITRKYKEDYRNGSSKEKEEIKRNLKKIRVKGKALYTNEDFRNWEEEEDK